MVKKKACKKCKIFVSGELCPICKKNSFTTSWKGRIHIVDSEKSKIAKQIGIDKSGEYAIKVR
ncbi:DNA-directed RNA polymerase subunit E'' [Candidatus Woesearchaeota archaeon]|jgi:DNA-directed RNA polymerase subunit E"|nr:DNA-directed RNA polymerase subunit E'' [Candidatus Woesearchaeota archaeon]